jgi:hypothetical protein
MRTRGDVPQAQSSILSADAESVWQPIMELKEVEVGRQVLNFELNILRELERAGWKQVAEGIDNCPPDIELDEYVQESVEEFNLFSTSIPIPWTILSPIGQCIYDSFISFILPP